MDSISLLPNDALLEILSLLPTKDVLATSLVSKRWRYLWKSVPKLKYSYSNVETNVEHWRFVEFVNRSLLLNTAPILESFHFDADGPYMDIDFGFWIGIAVQRGLRELDLEYGQYIAEDPVGELPQIFFTCKTLVVLKLKYVSLCNLQFPVCLPLLKTLHLASMIYLDDESQRNLLASCPILQVLVVDLGYFIHMSRFPVMVPTLQRFIYYSDGHRYCEVVMNTPSLKYLKITADSSKCMAMPEIVEAYVKVKFSNAGDDLLRSLTSLKRLSLCLPSEVKITTGCIIFHQLVKLEFCTCETLWDLLISMLEHSPKLRSLKLYQIHDIGWRDEMFKDWDEPSSVPETLMFVLETFEWRNYRGWNIDRQLATFILKHSMCLKIAKFSLQESESGEKYRIMRELAQLSKGSTECELVFC